MKDSSRGFSIGGWIRDLAVSLAREPGETERLEDRSAIWAKRALFGVMSVALVGFFAAFFVPEIRSWRDGRPSLPVNPSEWRVLYHDTSDLSELWSSPARRTDAGHRERVRALAGKTFWLGMIIRGDLARRALDAGALQFILGHISASHRVWVDGELVAEGNYRDNSLPIVLRLPLEHAVKTGETRIAIRIQHDAGNPMPDFLNADFGGEGFAASTAIKNYLKLKVFHIESRPFALSLTQFVLALLFFFFWLSAPKKQEYFYMACFSLVHSWIQLSYVDFVYRALGSNWTYTTDCILTLSEGTFTLFLGLSFARASLNFFKYALPVFLLFPFGLVALPFADPAAKFSFSAVLGQIYVPFGYFFGAAACLLQSYLIRRTVYSVRKKRLILFGTALAVLGAFQFHSATGLASAVEFAVLYQFTHLSIVLFLGYVVISEYRETEKIVSKTHLSKYHRRPALPSFVDGTLLKIDLKGSTQLEAQVADYEGPSYGKASTIWFSWMAEVILKNGGELLAEEGDLIMAFFDNETHVDSLLAAVQTAQKLEERQQELPTLFGIQKTLNFRGSAVSGQLKPVWKQSGTRRLPGYEGNLLVDASRLMELEYEIENNQNKTLLVVESKELSGRNLEQWQMNVAKKDSDGKERVIGLIWLKSLHPLPSLKKAA